MSNPKERCAACGMPRNAHWGPRPICAGRCTGFESSATERARAAGPALLAVLKRIEAWDKDASGLPAEGNLDWDLFDGLMTQAREAIAAAEG